MHYYKKNIGDYAKKTGRLSILQHGAYTLLIDACYDREQFPSLDDAMDWLLPIDNEEKDAIEFVLKRFFTLSEGVYVQNRIKEEIDAYHEKAIKNKEIALNRELAKKNKARNVNETCKKREPNQEPITKNHKPRTIDKSNVKLQATLTSDIFEFWQLTMDHPRSKLDNKRKNLINNALKLGYSVDELKTAIDGCSKTPHNMGQNDRGETYDGLHIILKDADNVDRFIRNSNSPPISNKSSTSAINQSSNAAMNLINGTGEDYAAIR